MSALTVCLSDTLHKNIKSLVRTVGFTVNQFLATAAAEKMAVLMTVDYLRQEAAEGRREDFDRFLKAVPARAPLAGDEIPAAS